MGHLPGWILEFGDHPAVLGSYARFVGEPFAAFRDNLIGSHSHDMAVAAMALVLAAAVSRYGYCEAAGYSRLLSRGAVPSTGFTGGTCLPRPLTAEPSPPAGSSLPGRHWVPGRAPAGKVTAR